MTYEDLIAGVEAYGSSKADICRQTIGVDPEVITEQVIVAPWWEPDVFTAFADAKYRSKTSNASEKVWSIAVRGRTITYIKTGIGAPSLMDVILALGVTNCRQILFVGSVGALTPDMGIGDIVIPEYSISGDGASRYIKNDVLAKSDPFGDKVCPDGNMLELAKAAAVDICGKCGVKWHLGSVFSIDTILAQFAHIGEIQNMGCNAIEMETAAAFEAAALAKLPIAALLSVSDNTVVNKSLISGRTNEENTYRKSVRRDVFPRMILKIFERAVKK